MIGPGAAAHAEEVVPNPIRRNAADATVAQRTKAKISRVRSMHASRSSCAPPSENRVGHSG